MATSLETLQRELRVRVVRRDDRDEVDIRLAEHFGDRGVSLNAREIGLGNFQALGIDLADGHRRHAGLFHFLEMAAPHVEGPAIADDSDANLGCVFVFFHDVVFVGNQSAFPAQRMPFSDIWKTAG